MAGEVERWGFDLDTQQAQASLDQFAGRMTAAFTASSLAVQALDKVIAGVVGTMKKGWSDALQWEVTNKRLAAALKSTGHEVDSNVAALNAQSSALESLLGISDETIRTMQTQALQMGVTADKMDDTIKAAITLSKVVAGRGGGEINVVSALMMLQRAQQGTVPEMMKTLNAFKGLTAEELRNVDVTKRIIEYHGDMMAVGMDTTSGAVTRLSTSWANLGEAMAKVAATSQLVAGALDTIAQKVQGVANLFENREWWKIYLGVVGGGLTGGGFIGSALGLSAAGEFAAQPGAAPTATGPGGAAAPGLMLGEIDIMKMAAEQKRKAEDRRRAQLAAVQTYEGDTGITYGGFGGSSEMPEYASGVESEMALIESRADRRMRAEEMVTKYLDEQAQYRLEIAAKEAEGLESTYEPMPDIVGDIFSSMTSSMLGSLQALATGQKVSLEEIAGDFVTSIGRQLIASGQRDILEGGARAIRSYGADPSAWSLIAQGTAEVGAGLGFAAAGAFAMSGPQAPSGGGGSAASGGGRVMGQFDSGAGYRVNEKSKEGDTYIIEISGPVLNDHHFGAMIQQALNEKARRGL